MKQISFAIAGFEFVTGKTLKRVFRGEMNLVVPWADLVGLIEPPAPTGKTERPPLCSGRHAKHSLHATVVLGLSEPAMKEALHDMQRQQTGSKQGAVCP